MSWYEYGYHYIDIDYINQYQYNDNLDKELPGRSGCGVRRCSRLIGRLRMHREVYDDHSYRKAYKRKTRKTRIKMSMNCTK